MLKPLDDWESGGFNYVWLMLVDYCCVNGLELLVCKMILGIQLLLKLSLRLMEPGAVFHF